MDTRKQRSLRAKPADAPAAGRVVFDSRGNPVWEWNTSSGDSTSVLLKQFQNDDLALEPTRSSRSIQRSERRRAAESDKNVARVEPPELELELQQLPSGGGFDPYNRS